MTRYLLRRFVSTVVLLLVMVAFVYVIFYALPSDPAVLVCGKGCGGGQLAAIDHKLGLDQPEYVQFWHFLEGIFVGRDYSSGPDVSHCAAPCLGFSFQNDQPVLSLIGQRLPVSLSLTAGGAVLWLLIGVGAGVLSALRVGRFTDRAVTAASILAFGAPIFVSGMLLLILFCGVLHWMDFPVYVPLSDDPAAWAKNLLLPWFTLAIAQAAVYARLTRTGMLETLSEDHIRTFRAYGLRERRIVGRHAIRGALTPVITMSAHDFGYVLVGAMLTETLFGLPGLGQLIVQSSNNVDLPVVAGLTLVAGAAIVVANTVADLLYAVVDRRVVLS
ncbi:ABC transporter permease [Actinoallomurus sp. NBC_01490]|uniref:ABC transporter permease n=1 Tax=Actinoallomurus sp. NBC_01490 TaxID=2903557 RepID=UPI002E302FE7|nr:ABC transporter permease [Actinoallomurus sp. NBC_01490]